MQLMSLATDGQFYGMATSSALRKHDHTVQYQGSKAFDTYGSKAFDTYGSKAFGTYGSKAFGTYGSKAFGTCFVRT